MKELFENLLAAFIFLQIMAFIGGIAVGVHYNISNSYLADHLVDADKVCNYKENGKKIFFVFKPGCDIGYWLAEEN